MDVARRSSPGPPAPPSGSAGGRRSGRTPSRPRWGASPWSRRRRSRPAARPSRAPPGSSPRRPPSGWSPRCPGHTTPAFALRRATRRPPRCRSGRRPGPRSDTSAATAAPRTRVRPGSSTVPRAAGRSPTPRCAGIAALVSLARSWNIDADWTKSHTARSYRCRASSASTARFRVC